MDPDAFHKLALAEVAAVHRLAVHLTRSQHEAEDLVQETYLRAMRSADGFAPGEHGIRPWLFKILHNLLHTRRARDRRAADVLRNLPEPNGLAEQPAGGAGSASSALNWDAMDERLCDAIRNLPVMHRTVFLLSAVEELKYREIADVVGVPVGTVMSRLSRARAAMAAQLDGLAADRNLRRADRRRQRPPTGANA